MAVESMPSQQRLSELLRYDTTTGELSWRERERDSFPDHKQWAQWRTRFANKRAGKSMTNGSGKSSGIWVFVDQQLLPAHRIIWVILRGAIPEGLEVDHRDTNPLINLATNLRLATRTQQAQNRNVRSDNQTGLKGVFRDRKRYRSRIRVNGKDIHLGTFDSPDEAHAAYSRAAFEYFGEFARA